METILHQAQFACQLDQEVHGLFTWPWVIVVAAPAVGDDAFAFPVPFLGPMLHLLDHRSYDFWTRTSH